MKCRTNKCINPPILIGTTIPAYTVVMTGTPAGVGAFQSPRQFLKDNDVVEVEVTGLGTLRNVIRFVEGQDSMR